MTGSPGIAAAPGEGDAGAVDRVETLLEGRRPDTALRREAARALQADIAPIDDVRAAASYRRIAAAVLLDSWALLGRPSLRAAEEALRRWMNAAALVRPGPLGGKVVIMADPGLAVVQALIRWDPATHSDRELAERKELRFPPSVRIAALTGPPDAVGEVLAARDRLLEGLLLPSHPAQHPVVRIRSRHRVAQGDDQLHRGEIARDALAAFGKRKIGRAHFHHGKIGRAVAKLAAIPTLPAPVIALEVIALLVRGKADPAAQDLVEPGGCGARRPDRDKLRHPPIRGGASGYRRRVLRSGTPASR